MSVAAAAREIREEIGLDITDLQLLGALENIFTYEGELGHEIVFVYAARFVDGSAYATEEFVVTEDNGDILTARWLPLAFFNGYHRLVPEGIKELIHARATESQVRGKPLK